MTIAAIILAAGSSSRMGEGRHKLLLPLGERPILAHVLESTCVSQADPILVVLGHQAPQIRQSLTSLPDQRSIHYLENTAYQQGMSSSLRLGVQALSQLIQSGQKIDGCLVILGDQPLLTSTIIDTLIQYHNETKKAIIAPLYAGKRGHPVLFASRLFAELQQVSGDEGGRSIIARHQDELRTIEVGPGPANDDIDTWEAYQALLQRWQKPDAHDIGDRR
ncbi:nucleotidyltransferase family protein [Tengunoibacter tsumagoiensis]|uniref:Molybdenum cofactor cytidylyltransferase n=1 Tax=Tengunoibacter tsumagoiensis TaxID=2014871 RepID=A0A401ZYY4_9CHLR|nr:nucleotidyltransferase family protein [Tengunoibacter tsumagoiensis]GCE12032.1 molybdenum cofactor cytidylyltransferase [Tengunoibacter tsumagoiensis]